MLHFWWTAAKVLQPNDIDLLPLAMRFPAIMMPTTV